MAKNWKSVSTSTSHNSWETQLPPAVGPNQSFFIANMEKDARKRIAHYILPSSTDWGRIDKENSVRLYQQVLVKGHEFAEDLRLEYPDRSITLKLVWMYEETPIFDCGQDGHVAKRVGECVEVAYCQLYEVAQRELLAN